MKNFIKTFSAKILLLAFLFTPGLAYGHLRVDAAKTYGTVPDVISSSIWLHHLANEDIYTLGKFLKDNRPKVIQLSLTVLQRSKSFDDYKKLFEKYLDEDAPRLLVRKAAKENFRIVIGFDPCPMPAWLSSRPGDKRPASNWGYSIQTCSAPSDFKLWADVVSYTLKAFKDRGVKKLGVYIGHEQEREWMGDEKSFFKYYEYAARAAKALDKSIAVGGPGPSGWKEKRLGCKDYPAGAKEICEKDGGWKDPEGESFIKNFIDYAATKGVGTTRVPLDFINWHNFGPNTESFSAAAATINGWLKDKGLKGVRLYPSDWSGWNWPPYPADFLDTAEFASFIPQALYSMWKAGIQWQGHDFNVFSGGLEKKTIMARKNSTFIGDWGLFTRHGKMKGGIIKPSYNTFKLLSMMAGPDKKRKILQAKFSDFDTVKAFSTRDGKRVYILLSNHVPKGRRFQKFFALKVSTFLQDSGMEEEDKWLRSAIKEYSRKKTISSKGSAREKELITYIGKAAKCTRGKDPEGCEKAAANGLKDPANKKAEDGVRATVNSVKPRDINIEIDSLPASGGAELVSYTVDDFSSNACAYNKRTESKKSGVPCGIDGAIDKKVMAAYKAATTKGKQAAKKELVKWFGPARARSIARAAKQCMRSGAGMKKCLKKSSSKGMEEGVRASIKSFQRARAREYYGRINAINNLPEVSVEGSRKVERVSVKGGKAEFKVTMNPDSVMLLILQKGSGGNAEK